MPGISKAMTVLFWRRCRYSMLTQGFGCTLANKKCCKRNCMTFKLINKYCDWLKSGRKIK